MRARVYDDEVRKWVADVGVENLGKRLINSKEGPPTFAQPAMTLQTLLNYGNMLVAEQDNVKRVQLADTYLEGAALGNANEDDFRRLANNSGAWGVDLGFVCRGLCKHDWVSFHAKCGPRVGPSHSYSNSATQECTMTYIHDKET